MTEIDVLDRDIQGLKRLLQVAWEELANRSFTPFEYREKRNEMDRVAAELRERLKTFEAQHNRVRERPPVRPGARPVALRLLA
jgi:hypothetical protein